MQRWAFSEGQKALNFDHSLILLLESLPIHLFKKMLEHDKIFVINKDDQRERLPQGSDHRPNHRFTTTKFIYLPFNYTNMPATFQSFIFHNKLSFEEDMLGDHRVL